MNVAERKQTKYFFQNSTKLPRNILISEQVRNRSCNLFSETVFLICVVLLFNSNILSIQTNQTTSENELTLKPTWLRSS